MNEQTKEALNEFINVAEGIEPSPSSDESVEPATESSSSESAQIAKLEGQLAAMQNMLTSMQTQAKVEEQPKVETQLPSFVSEEDLTDLISEDGTVSKEGLMKLLQNVAGRSFSLARETLHRELPEITESAITRQTAITTAATTFWQNNSDLKPFQGELRNEVNNLSNQNPNLSIGELFDRAGKNVRSRIAAYKQAAQTVENTSSNAFGHVHQGKAPSNKKVTPDDMQAFFQTYD